MRLRPRSVLAASLLAACLLAGAASAQQPLRATRYLANPYDTQATQRFGLQHTAPVVHRWYAPRHLAETYARPWYATDTFYARDHYRRYIDRQLEGDEWYDTFGAPIGRSWVLYNWQQRQPQRNGTNLLKGTRVLGATNAYREFFQGLVIASDTRGGATMRLMAGDRIHTVFTPFTLSKPNFDGLRFDYADDRIEGTVVLSRVGAPTGERNNTAQLYGGHVAWSPLPAATVGLTYVNAHTVQTEAGFADGHPLSGVLTTAQHQPLQKLWVRLTDDSPEDGAGGATLYRHDLILQRSDGDAWRASTLGLLPRIEGGSGRDGALVADGLDAIVLEYDLSSLRFEDLESIDIRRAVVELTVANDYRVELASDLQNDGDRGDPQTVFFVVHRANGNGADESNTRLLYADYGLPTANGLLGFDGSLVDWHGLSVQGEAVFNRRYFRYPGLAGNDNHLTRLQAPAAYLQASYESLHVDAFFETFSVHADYTTSFFLPQSNGEVRYRAPVPDLYEFVEDDDDHDGVPEWQRPFQPSSLLVAWPGFDEHRDFLHDHNQNGNLQPDYEEPFLRFRADRPEFLFGPDMNHNGTVDRFENDLLPDYPYKLDHHGYNGFVRAAFGPGISLLVGRQRTFQRESDLRTDAHYLLGACDVHTSGHGRLRLFDMAVLVSDDIADDLHLWHQPVGGFGRMRAVPDPLAARNTFRNTFYADYDQSPADGMRLFHRLKWDWWRQLAGDARLRAREGRRHAGFFGLVDRGEWVLPVGRSIFEPRYKSEWRHDRPFSTHRPTSTSTEQSLILLWTRPLFAESARAIYFNRYGRQIFDTQVQFGLDLSRRWLLSGARDDLDQDVTTRVVAAQLSNRVAYEGYHVVTRLGFQWTRRDFQRDGVRRSNLFFLTVNAGLR